MTRAAIEVIAIGVGLSFAVFGAQLISPDENVGIIIGVVGGIAVWEAVRFVLLRQWPSG